MMARPREMEPPCCHARCNARWSARWNVPCDTPRHAPWNAPCDAKARLRVREVLAAAAGTAVPEVAATFYPATLGEEVLALLEAAGATLRTELASRSDAEGGPLMSLEVSSQ